MLFCLFKAATLGYILQGAQFCRSRDDAGTVHRGLHLLGEVGVSSEGGTLPGSFLKAGFIFPAFLVNIPLRRLFLCCYYYFFLTTSTNGGRSPEGKNQWRWALKRSFKSGFKTSSAFPIGQTGTACVLHTGGSVPR